jgi:hypothetical protein
VKFFVVLLNIFVGHCIAKVTGNVRTRLYQIMPDDTARIEHFICLQLFGLEIFAFGTISVAPLKRFLVRAAMPFSRHQIAFSVELFRQPRLVVAVAAHVAVVIWYAWIFVYSPVTAVVATVEVAIACTVNLAGHQHPKAFERLFPEIETRSVSVDPAHDLSPSRPREILVLFALFL